jgi:hypothetical protein
VRQFADTDTGPGAKASGEYPVLHLAKHRHVLRHVNMISGHLDNVLEAAASSGKHVSQVFPSADELLLGIPDHFQFSSPSYLACTVQGVADLDCGGVTRALDDGFHGVWNDDFTVRHTELLGR